MIRLPVAFTAAGLTLGVSLSTAAPEPIPPEVVAVIYNSEVPDSKVLANHYARARQIPKENLIGLPLPETDEISRTDYDAQLRDPLQKIFDERSWWKREVAASNLLQPVTNKIRFLVTVRGVPFKIARTPETIEPADRKRRIYKPSPTADEASVDAELSLFGISGYPIKGSVPNPLFRRDDSIMTATHTAVFLVGRLDGPDFAICTRLVDDALAVEKTGLRGMAYLDLAKKGGGYEAGDTWIENIATMNLQRGIPTVVDRNRDTYVTNYPMRDAAFYYGWYSHHRNGPFLNPDFDLRKGAVAVHLHSFSAHNLRSPGKRWTGPLQAKGAAATLGNVYEPFLALTHHFDIFHDRLMKGYTLGEAAFMALPTLSWQAVVLGDPLYRPFATQEPPAFDNSEDRAYKALLIAYSRWKDDRETLVAKLRSAAARMKSGILYEALGLEALANDENEKAAAFFTTAAGQYRGDSDKLRLTLHLADLERQTGRKDAALTRLREAEPKFADLPEGKAITALLNILDPPAPPPVQVSPKKK